MKQAPGAYPRLVLVYFYLKEKTWQGKRTSLVFGAVCYEEKSLMAMMSVSNHKIGQVSQEPCPQSKIRQVVLTNYFQYWTRPKHFGNK
jgi:hypothetical protein